MDGGEEVSGGLVIAGGNGTVLLELAVEILDEMACLVHFFIESTLVFAIALWRDHQVFSCRTKWFDHPLVGIEGFVCHQSIGLHLRQQRVGAFQVMGLAWSEQEGNRIAQRRRPRYESWCSTRLCCARSPGLRRLFLGAGTVLVGTHNGAIDHGVFIIRVGRQHLEHLLPHPTLGPARKSRMNFDRIAKALRQIAPGDASAIAIENRFDKQPVVLSRDPNMARTSRQNILDPVPLIIPQSIASHWSAPNQADLPLITYYTA